MVFQTVTRKNVWYLRKEFPVRILISLVWKYENIFLLLLDFNDFWNRNVKQSLLSLNTIFSLYFNRSYIIYIHIYTHTYMYTYVYTHMYTWWTHSYNLCLSLSVSLRIRGYSSSLILHSWLGYSYAAYRARAALITHRSNDLFRGSRSKLQFFIRNTIENQRTGPISLVRDPGRRSRLTSNN